MLWQSAAGAQHGAVREVRLRVLIGDSVVTQLDALDGRLSDTLRMAIGAAFRDAIAQRLCALHGAGTPVGPVQRVSYRRATETRRGDSVSVSHFLTHCDAPLRRTSAHVPEVLVFRLRDTRVDSLGSYVRLAVTSQINDVSLDADESTWLFVRWSGWQLTKYHRGGVDDGWFGPPKPTYEPLQPVQIARPPRMP